MRTCAFRGCLAAVVGSVRVTKDPARREPYTIDVCHAHRVAVLAAEGKPLPQPAPDAPIPEDEPMPSPRPPKPPPHLLVRKANPHIGFCVIEGCDATVGSRGICSNHQKSLPKEHYERLANPARQGGRPPRSGATPPSSANQALPAAVKVDFIVDNDWNGANERGGGDSDSLISGVVDIDSGEPTVPAAVAATCAEAQLAEAGRLAVQVEGLQADLARANTEIKHLQEKLTRAEGEWDDADKELEEAQAELKKATERIAELEGARDALRKLRDQMLIKVATITVCHDHHLRELHAATHMLKALGIKADSVVAGIQQLAQLPTNVLARRWAAWAKAQELMGQAEAELRVARGEVDDA